MTTRSFVVEVPRTRFPIDMLRYDSCWPDSEADANMIQDILDDNERQKLPRIVRIRLRTSDRMAPTVGRWTSFQCRVVDRDHR